MCVIFVWGLLCEMMSLPLFIYCLHLPPVQYHKKKSLLCFITEIEG